MPFLQAMNLYLPTFSDINVTNIVSDLNQILLNNLTAIRQLAEQAKPTWSSLALPLQVIDRKLQDFWLPINHLHAVKNSKPLREAYTVGEEKIAQYYADVAQNNNLFLAYQALQNSDEFDNYSPAQQQWVKNKLLRSRLAGVTLNVNKRQQLSCMKMRLAALAQHYSNAILDSTQAWKKIVKNDEDLKGLPESILILLKQQAKCKKEKGYLLTLDFPIYHAIMTYADCRELRRHLYIAYMTRASDQGPYAGQFDNSNTMIEMLMLRQKIAHILGYTDYAELSLTTKMVPSVSHVIDFLYSLADHAKPVASQELLTLQQYAIKHFQLNSLEPWDIAYVSERYRQHHFELSDTVLREYFSLEHVLEGLFSIVHRLFGVSIEAIDSFDCYDDDVRLYQLCHDGQPIAWCYLDLFSKDHKKGGAWVSDCRTRYRQASNELALPVAFLVCNFLPSNDDQPVLLNHNEVITLFHEFGHALHHLLTSEEVAGVSGMTNVEWDGVEFPSQWMEYWCWQEKTLLMLTKHYKTKKRMPKKMLRALIASRCFNVGMKTLRQIEYALFDMAIHSASIDSATDIQMQLQQIRDKIAILKTPDYVRFQHSFYHIFSSNYDYAYAAGYYGYLWAEVLAADAFSFFEKHGLFDSNISQAFLKYILQVGSSRPTYESFKRFRGRKPNINALLEYKNFKNQSKGIV